MAVARNPVARIAPPASAIISASRAREGDRDGQRGAGSTRLSIRAVGVVDPVARSRPQRRPRPGISLQRNPAPPATSPSCGQQQPLHRPGGGCGSVCRSRCAAPDCSATTRQGIKNTSSPAGNVGARARRRLPPAAEFLTFANASVDSLQRQCDALAPSDTQCHDAAPNAVTLHRMKEAGG